VRLALENNLGIRVARIDPQIQDLGVALARAGWAPAFTTTVQQASTAAGLSRAFHPSQTAIFTSAMPNRSA
jgi:hypothetical protein